jgi:peptidoglycan/LPS O-acetylase OafA/YrhL
VVLETKLLSQFSTPLLGVITSHLFFFDPWGVQWAANFIVPAWWFVPAILLAYLSYPWIATAARVRRGIPLLAVSAAITMVSYALSTRGILINETWYFIVLQESFNFCLGVVVAEAWMGASRGAIEGLISDPRALVVAMVVFVAGNVANWIPDLRPIASMLYGPSLVLVVAFVGKRLEERRVGRMLLSCDSYDLYLVHQPLAFPIALVSKALFHAYGIFVGWFVFAAAAIIAARLLSAVQKYVLRFRTSPVQPIPRAERQPVAATTLNVPIGRRSDGVR